VCEFLTLSDIVLRMHLTENGNGMALRKLKTCGNNSRNVGGH
jgi:hypothetical protein